MEIWAILATSKFTNVMGYALSEEDATQKAALLQMGAPEYRFSISLLKDLTDMQIVPGIWKGDMIISATYLGKDVIALNYAMVRTELERKTDILDMLRTEKDGDLSYFVSERGIHDRYRVKRKYSYDRGITETPVVETTAYRVEQSIENVAGIARDGYDVNKSLLKVYVQVRTADSKDALYDELNRLVSQYQAAHPGDYTVSTM